jgi:hypothetical protein
VKFPALGEVVLLTALSVFNSSAQAATTLTDTSPHKVLSVTTDGVKLEVLDWGGTGRPLVLLDAHGPSAFYNAAEGNYGVEMAEILRRLNDLSAPDPRLDCATFSSRGCCSGSSTRSVTC